MFKGNPMLNQFKETHVGEKILAERKRMILSNRKESNISRNSSNRKRKSVEKITSDNQKEKYNSDKQKISAWEEKKHSEKKKASTSKEKKSLVLRNQKVLRSKWEKV